LDNGSLDKRLIYSPSCKEQRVSHKTYFIADRAKNDARQIVAELFFILLIKRENPGRANWKSRAHPA
jgi:hypothetical protein